MRISDWSSDVCSSDLGELRPLEGRGGCLADILEALRWRGQRHGHGAAGAPQIDLQAVVLVVDEQRFPVGTAIGMAPHFPGRHGAVGRMDLLLRWRDRKSTRLNSSH